MNFKLIGILSLLIVMFSCNDDTNTNRIISYTQEEVNSYDDQALVNVLNEYYFDSYGNIKPFSTSDTSDDNFPKLMTYATKRTSGIWVVTRPDVEAKGDFATSDKKLTLQYNGFYFKSYKKEDGSGTYSSLTTDNIFSNILQGTGQNKTDPYFVYAPLYNTDDVKSDYEIEGIVEGLKEFKATNNPSNFSYNLQGVILVPSRLAYGRDLAYYNPMANSKRTSRTNGLNDQCFVFNFELKKVENR